MRGFRPSFVLIGLFYPLIVAASVLLLAVVQLRSSADTSYDIWRLNYRSVESLTYLLDAQTKDILRKISGVSDDLNMATYCLDRLADEAFKSDVIDGAVGKKVKTALAAVVDGEAWRKFIGDERCIARGNAGWQFEKITDPEKLKTLQKELDANQIKIAENQLRYTDLVRGHQDFLAFVEMEKSSRWYVNLIAATPYDLLVLFLVMFMGALGGIVRLLRDYGDEKRPDPQPRDYLFIPLIGMVVAIGGFVLAKTGLLLLSSTKQEASLSPFMIGLVGIISGLLAREVIDAIARAGANMMKASVADQPSAEEPRPDGPQGATQ